MGKICGKAIDKAIADALRHAFLSGYVAHAEVRPGEPNRGVDAWVDYELHPEILSRLTDIKDQGRAPPQFEIV